jgi:BASS family bile acid:Na+ symporter
MVVAVGLLIVLNFQAMLDTLGSLAVAAALVFVLAMVVTGYLLGGPSPTTCSVLGLGTGQRNIAAALIAAGGSSDDPRVVVMLLLSTIAGLFVLLAAALLMARRPRLLQLSAARERTTELTHRVTP